VTARSVPESGVENDYDLIVIGGGINGAGIARDAALRGLRVLLLEMNDFGSGTSSWSSRLIHGGLRYLEHGDFALVFESLRERRLLQRLAPHLVRRLRLTIPVYDSSRRGMWLVRLGMIVYDLLSIGKAVPRHRMLARRSIIEAVPGINEEGLRGGASYFDAQVSYAERLVFENILGAREAGADVRNYSPVIGINVRNNQLQSVHFLDHGSGQEMEATATVVVNAAGPWVDEVLSTVNRKIPGCMGGTKGSHIAVGLFEGAPRDAIYAESIVDGRPFFIIPWNEQVLIGTTDIRFSGDPADARASRDEIDYLLNETNHLFPHARLRLEDIHYAYAGIRPLPARDTGPESAITRKHIIKKHRLLARGLVSIIGGKLTTYRNLAEQAVDYVNRKNASKGSRCRTRTLPLPGAVGIDEARSALQEVGTLSSAGVRRLLAIYGGRAIGIARLAAENPRLAMALDADGRVIAAEIEFVAGSELVVSLIDIVHRRMMIGLDANQGRDLADAVSRLAAPVLGWSESERKRQLRDLTAYSDRFLVRRD